MRSVAFLIVLLLAGCAGGEATRWMGAESKIVSVEGVPYQVSWVRDPSGIDMRGVRTTPIVLLPDTMVERRRNTEAALAVGNDLCGGKASVAAEMRDGDMFATRIKCG